MTRKRAFYTTRIPATWLLATSVNNISIMDVDNARSHFTYHIRRLSLHPATRNNKDCVVPRGRRASAGMACQRRGIWATCFRTHMTVLFLPWRYIPFACTLYHR